MKYDIKIDDYIGWGESSAYAVIPKVEALEGQPCNVYVSSFGGSVQDGLQIYQAFKDHGNVTVYFFGMSASAATILAMGAKDIKMSKNALLLIHRASLYQSVWSSMNREQIEQLIAELKNDQHTLDKLDEIIAAIYAEHAKGDTKLFAEQMQKEEWISANDALACGLVDEIIEEGEATAMTADLGRRLVACGYPVPQLEKAPERPSFMDRLRAGLASLGLLPENNGGNAENSTTAATAAITNTQPTTTMNKSFKAIMAVLAVEALAQTEDGSITLSAEQMQAMETALANAQTQAAADQQTIAERDQQITALNEQVQNLMKDDGEQVEEEVPPTAETATDFLSTMSNLLRDI